MSDLFLLSERQMALISPYFRSPMALRVLTSGVLTSGVLTSGVL